MDGTGIKHRSCVEKDLPFGPTPDCPEIDEICMYLDGTASDELVSRLEEHLADCLSCRKAVLEMRKNLSGAVVAPFCGRCTEKAKELIKEKESNNDKDREYKAMA
ncbi:anti-sigma factor family protein [Maridesulfovibrio sp. FT414]|uniref:anti-sigma factor family protein n=1 Tax=Maridesulfovibrio sp. FT414 TaxID=2979469 RepID=UPI003D802BDA